MLKVHHLNCGSMCPFGGKFFDGFSQGLTANLACHCLAIETNEGLVLVDTGFGMEDIRRPYSRLSAFFIHFNNIQFDPEHTALRQIEKLGFHQNDVRHIVLTHLDFDHAGGISDFPEAKVHVMSRELQAAQNPDSLLARRRYRHKQWDFEKNWITYEAGRGERWFGFECVRDLHGLPPEILMVPLVGHTWGHAGVAVQSQHGWLLNAGDAYFYRGEMNEEYYCTPGLRLYQKMMEVDRKSRLFNQNRLRTLVNRHGYEVKVFSAHDALEMIKFSSVDSIEPHPSQWTPKTQQPVYRQGSRDDVFFTPEQNR